MEDVLGSSFSFSEALDTVADVYNGVSPYLSHFVGQLCSES